MIVNGKKKFGARDIGIVARLDDGAERSIRNIQTKLDVNSKGASVQVRPGILPEEVELIALQPGTTQISFSPKAPNGQTRLHEILEVNAATFAALPPEPAEVHPLNGGVTAGVPVKFQVKLDGPVDKSNFRVRWIMSKIDTRVTRLGGDIASHFAEAYPLTLHDNRGRVMMDRSTPQVAELIDIFTKDIIASVTFDHVPVAPAAVTNIVVGLSDANGEATGLKRLHVFTPRASGKPISKIVSELEFGELAFK
jgi:hypothetical protein